MTTPPFDDVHNIAAYEAGKKDAEKAFGGCKNCYGKGYTTILQYIEGGHGSDYRRNKMPLMRFCRCARGKQLRAILDM